MKRRRVLMVGFHFPPTRGSSGVQRLLHFARHLPAHGWDPTVLTVHPRAYVRTGDDLLQDVPKDLRVVRAFGLHSARHLSIRGAYPDWVARPDPWWTWALGAIPAGMRLIRDVRPDLVWATFPISTALVIGRAISAWTRTPLVIDLRDPIGQSKYPDDLVSRRMFWALERRVVPAASRCVVTTPGARRLYAERFPELPESRFAVIENGFAEEAFEGVVPPAEGADRPIRFLHSGVLYRSDRDPVPFLRAVAALCADGTIVPGRVEFVLRAAGSETYYGDLVRELGIADVVRLEPAVPYREALSEMSGADVLLAFQGSNCNRQIPAKLYEYFRAGRPILGLTDPVGDTARVLGAEDRVDVVRIDDEEAIREAIARAIREAPARRDLEPRADVARWSRRTRTRELAAVLDDALEGPTSRAIDVGGAA